uniref:Uncharacterized protein n=1 Tax=Oryza sativa subsp. japonica TaxID=39947 RepID=Q6K1T7_ORYSJ|nr:hypothetical protein [Oryza sativa Japonica Group]
MAMSCMRLHSEMALQTSRALESADHSKTSSSSSSSRSLYLLSLITSSYHLPT